MNHWKRKAIALAKLAEDQRGKPEGETARRKLLEIINKHPEVVQLEEVKQLTLADLGQMKRRGISLAGSWTGNDLQDAIRLMEEDYRQRMAESRPKPLLN